MTGLCAPWELAQRMGVELDPTRGESRPWCITAVARLFSACA